MTTPSTASDLKYKRVLLKLSGEACQGADKHNSLDPPRLMAMARQVEKTIQLGAEVSIVVGGGNIFRGLAGMNRGIERTTGDYMGMLATVINCLAIQATLEDIGIETRVMTAIRMPAIAEPFVRRRALRHLEKGRVVIFGAGTGNPFFTTDSAAALRASEIGADVLLKGTKVDGVYTADPRKDPNAKRYSDITFREAINQDLGIMDTAAFSLCMENGIPIIVFDVFKEDEIIRVLKGEKVGTLVHA
jgi:uridylate kinase